MRPRETWCGPLPTRGPRSGTPWRPSERSSGSRHSTEQFIPSDVASAALELRAGRTGVYAGGYSPNLVEGEFCEVRAATTTALPNGASLFALFFVRLKGHRRAVPK